MDFRENLADIGYRYQFITLAGWHSMNNGMFELAKSYRESGMLAYSNLQEKEFANEDHGFRAAKHQAFVGAGYFDSIQNTIMQGHASTVSLTGSTEEEQFDTRKKVA